MFANYIAVREIEIGPCLCDAVCSARRCQRKARVIARAFDTGGRPVQQYELCPRHGQYIAAREKRKGRAVLFLLN
jgi:hypothetical protein